MKAEKSDNNKDISLEQFDDPSREWRRVFSELWGTFLLVLAGAGAAMAGKWSGEVTKAMEAVAPGMTVMVVIYFMGTISGAHLNPGVTLAFALRSHFPWKRVPFYILAQFAGGILAILFLKATLGDAGRLGATVPADGLATWKACIIEAIITTGLVNTILGTASGSRNVGSNGAIAVGAYIALAGLWAGSLTGASMNMARSLSADYHQGELRNELDLYCRAAHGRAPGSML